MGLNIVTQKKVIFSKCFHFEIQGCGFFTPFPSSLQRDKPILFHSIQMGSTVVDSSLMFQTHPLPHNRLAHTNRHHTHYQWPKCHLPLPWNGTRILYWEGIVGQPKSLYIIFRKSSQNEEIMLQQLQLNYISLSNLHCCGPVYGIEAIVFGENFQDFDGQGSGGYQDGFDGILNLLVYADLYLENLVLPNFQSEQQDGFEDKNNNLKVIFVVFLCFLNAVYFNAVELNVIRNFCFPCIQFFFCGKREYYIKTRSN